MNKQAPQNDVPFTLPDQRVIALRGRDALKFAQAQWMNDVDALADGHWQWNGWLTPKGRVIALFALLRFDRETLWLVMPDTIADDVAAGLRRFVFRSKVEIGVRDDLRGVAAFATPVAALGNRFDAAAIDGIGGSVVELDFSADAGSRRLCLVDSVATTNDVAADNDGAARWKAFDLLHGLPRLAPAQAEAWTPQQLSLQRLRAFSVTKGCYPGQEIVARTYFLGQAKRGLALLQANVPVDPGTDVLSGDRAIGTVVSAAAVPDDGEWRLLAVIPIDTTDDVPLRAGDSRLTIATMRGGLAR
ncbi:MAG: YgfZ/GcvT domain-containing protein [Luteimonas sp.]